MPHQEDDDKVLHQDAHEEVIGDILDGVTTENVAIADPGAPSAGYVQAEAAATNDAVIAILEALRSSGIIPTE